MKKSSDLDITNKMKKSSNSGIINEEKKSSNLNIIKKKKKIQHIKLIDFYSGKTKKTYKVNKYNDNLYDLLLNVAEETDIPIYRIYVKGIKTHNIYYDLNIIDTQDLFENKKTNIKIGNYYIDKKLYDNKENVRIVSLDKFDNYYPDTIEIVDMLNVIQLDITIYDEYELSLLYNGYVIKYWPKILNINMFINILQGNLMELKTRYPLYFISNNVDYKDPKITSKKYVSYIKYGYTTNVSNSINITTLFNEITLTKEMPYIEINYYKDYKKHTLEKRFILYTDSLKPHTWVDHSVKLIIADNIYEIHSNGSYYIEKKWKTEEFMSIDAAQRVCDTLLHELIVTFKKHILSTHINADNVYAIASVDYIINFNTYFSTVRFKYIREIITNLENPFILKVLAANISNLILFKLYRGVQYFDKQNKIITRFLHQRSRFTLLPNMYTYLSNKESYYSWTNVYSGIYIKFLKTTQITLVEIKNIQNVDSIDFIISFILDLLYKSLEVELIQSKITPVKSEVKNLRVFDPVLYNIEKDGKQIFSKLCQSYRQPKHLSKDNYNKLNKEDKKKYVKYWNFTEQTDAYYICSNKKYPYLYFKGDIHPKHYMVPCCGQVEKDITYELKTKIYNEQEVKKVNYVLKFDRKIIPERFTLVPNKFNSIMKNLEMKQGWKLAIYGLQNMIKNRKLLYSLSFCINEDIHVMISEFINAINKIYKTYIYLDKIYEKISIITSLEDIENNALSILNVIDEEQWKLFIFNIFLVAYNIKICEFTEDNLYISFNNTHRIIFMYEYNPLCIINTYMNIKKIIFDKTNIIPLKIKNVRDKSIEKVFVDNNNYVYYIKKNGLYVPVQEYYNNNIYPVDYDLPKLDNDPVELLKTLDFVTFVIQNTKNEYIGFISNSLFYFHLPIKKNITNVADIKIFPYLISDIEDRINKYQLNTFYAKYSKIIDKSANNNLQYIRFVDIFRKTSKFEKNKKIRTALLKSLQKVNSLSANNINFNKRDTDKIFKIMQYSENIEQEINDTIFDFDYMFNIKTIIKTMKFTKETFGKNFNYFCEKLSTDIFNETIVIYNIFKFKHKKYETMVTYLRT